MNDFSRVSAQVKACLASEFIVKHRANNSFERYEVHLVEGKAVISDGTMGVAGYFIRDFSDYAASRGLLFILYFSRTLDRMEIVII